MDFEETEARDDCAGEGQKQFNRPTADILNLLHKPVLTGNLCIPRINVT
jgi:hypothetical protein